MFVGVYSRHPGVSKIREHGFVGLDNQWRFEIDDSRAEISLPVSKTEILNLGEGCLATDVMLLHMGVPAPAANCRKLADVLFHQELFLSYPGLERVPAVFFQCGHSPVAEFHALPYAAGRLAYSDCHLAINVTQLSKMNPLRVIGVLLHELQHVIQVIEGFAIGGSPGNEFYRLLDERGLVESEITDVERRQLTELAKQRYILLAGEIEAREVEARMLMDRGFRTINRPYLRLDASTAIVRTLHGDQMLAAAYS